jgi:4-hydroxy-2-oxoheptanedioate aldolase
MATFRETLKTGVPQLGLVVMYPSAGVVERIGPDWDWVWIDGQHGELGYSDLIGLVRACDFAKRPAFVRVPGHETGPIGLALDMGATGVIVPCVDTPEQAKALVSAAKLPPMGERSYGGRRPIDLHGRLYSDTANTDTLLVCQIETPLAIRNVEKIAAIEGVDALFLGPDDILLRRGYKMDAPRNREALWDDMTAVTAACKKYGKFGVMVGVGAEMFKLALEAGFHMIVGGGDVGFLAGGSKTASAEVRAILKAQAPQADAKPKTSSLYG